MLSYEEATSNFEVLLRYYTENQSDRNEATTRLQLIDRLLFNVLGWDRESDCVVEEAHAGEYADYTLSAPRPILIVEAKREGDYFEVPAGQTGIFYKISQLSRDNPNLRDAILQAMRYCQARGVPFGAVANGHQLVAFVAVRTDGVSPVEGKAIVFPSLEFIANNFLKLWQALSKSGIEEGHLRSYLIGEVIPQLPPKLSAAIFNYPGLKNRNIFQADLQIVAELVIEDVAKDTSLEDIFLKDCYCESGALSQHSLISKQILEARYAALFDSESGGPALQSAKTKKGIAPDLLASSISRRPILLIGDVGVGKTMFIHHLIRVDARQAFASVIDIRLDLGSGATLSTTLKEFVLHQIADQLEYKHGVNPYEGGVVRGVYDLELKKFAKSIYGALRDSDPGRYREKELEFLEERMRLQDQHLKAVLEHLSKARRKQIVLFLDNCDQRGYEVQQEAFLVAQEIASNWPATIFVSLRPETFHRSLKEGALTGYHPKAFTIAPPRVNLVIEKRLKFGLKITSGEIPITGISIPITATLSKLEAIISAFLHTLGNYSRFRECIDNISGGNVRRALDFVKQFFGSGHVDTRKIVDIFKQQGRYDIPLHEFLRAIIYGDNEYYDPEASPVANLFDVAYNDPREHFLLPILLSLLTNVSPSAADEGFVETGRVYEEIQGIGFVPEQIDSALIRAYRSKLVETTGRRAPDPGRELPSSIRLTTIGVYHIQRLAGMFTYIDAVVVDTPIFDSQVRQAIKDEVAIQGRLKRSRIFKSYLDSHWKAFDGLDARFPWPEHSRALEQEISVIEQRIIEGGQQRFL